jgi:hypothetical protein
LGGGQPTGYTWTEVTTDANGFNDAVNITWLCQCLLLSIGESPIWGDWGIPAQRSVMQQVFPDYYMVLMQQRFAQYFASLQLSKIPIPFPTYPAYNINLITHQGAQVSSPVPR